MRHRRGRLTPDLVKTSIASPFLKWAGGKGQLLNQLEPFLPERFDRYIEPFVGGGALFFRLSNLARLRNGAILNDINAEVMNCYRVIKDQALLTDLIRCLRYHSGRVMDPDHYYDVRAWDRDPDFLNRRTEVQRAARTIFLNHTCYNGLYRLNRSGQFNVPFGRWASPPTLFDDANLVACHDALQGVDLCVGSFEACVDGAGEGDFIYIDPPYAPLSKTSYFTSYFSTPFAREEQQKLAKVFQELTEKGCKLLLSNSDCDFVRELYGTWTIRSVSARRNINCKATKRGAVTELLILNYAP